MTLFLATPRFLSFTYASFLFLFFSLFLPLFFSLFFSNSVFAYFFLPCTLLLPFSTRVQEFRVAPLAPSKCRTVQYFVVLSVSSYPRMQPLLCPCPSLRLKLTPPSIVPHVTQHHQKPSRRPHQNTLGTLIGFFASLHASTLTLPIHFAARNFAS